MRSFAFPALFASALAQQIVLPVPDGPEHVTIRTSELTDVSRIDTIDPNHGHRRLMVSVYSPTADPQPDCSSMYALHKVGVATNEMFFQAANVTIDFDRFVLPLCSEDVTYGLPSSSDPPQYAPPSSTPSKQYPLVFFSPGLGGSRFLYNAINSFLASYGFIVVSIDHPYTVSVIEYPDGSSVYMTSSLAPNETEATAEVADRVADASFALDQITSNSTLSDLLFSAGAKPKSLDKVGFWGHSLGGATAAQSMLKDPRFSGGIDLDGSLFGSVNQEGLTDPFVLWQSDNGPNRTTYFADFWPKLRGFRRSINLVGITHLGIGDAGLLADSYGINRTQLGLGTIEGKRAVDILSAYAKDYFAFVLEGKDPGLMDKPSPEYPEVEFIP